MFAEAKKIDLHRVHNFNPGPAVLPLKVLEQAQAELLDYRGSGMSIMEISHRSKEFENIIQTAESDLRDLLGIPAGYKVMFLQGGASLQFAMIAMNFRPAGASADYLVTGAWSKTALKEAGKLGAARAAARTEDTNYNRLPGEAEIQFDPQAAYAHFTSNETIHGVEWKTEPVPPEGVPLFCDMSSNFVSRPVDVARYAFIYAGAQKNAGPAGVSVVIAREDMLARVPANLPALLDYKLLAESGSLHNTPPSWSIYIVGLVLMWLKDLGGLEAIARINAEKAGLLYQTIDQSGGFYRGHAQLESRSAMNVPFRMPTEELEKRFAKEAETQGLIGLKGHRSVGGLRASLYNALPLASVKALVDFMVEFQRTNG
jgi:phosphoserine aminotransferase